MLNAEQSNKITKLIEQISVTLTETGHKLFVKKPTAYIYPVKDKFLISLFDEEMESVQINISSKPKKGLVNFYMSRYFIDDLEPESITNFAEDKVSSYLEELREDTAYSKNLKRVQSLSESGHYLAAIVFLISAFETAMKGIFFRSNDLWFFWPEYLPDDFYDRYGKRISESESEKFDWQVHNGNRIWGFSKEGYDCLEKWRIIHNKKYVFNVSKQLGILDDYLLRLYSNQLNEIRSYEILKQTIENKGTRSAINFQMIEGTGGIRWTFKKFIGIDFNEVENDLQIIKEAAIKRHKIIHGFLDEKEIFETYVKEVEISVMKVVAFVRNEILEWSILFKL